jgi:hypothetical protein
MRTTPSIAIGFTVAVLAVACSSRPPTPGASPHDMSAAHHDAMATAEHAEAELHSAQYDPNAQGVVTRCPGGAAIGFKTDACWTTTMNPTAEHLEHAEEHRRRAADHRAASKALRDAEARACNGVSSADRDISPFEHREDIESITPLYSMPSGKHPTTRTLDGAIVMFRAVPNMTAQWLQHVVDCHLARNATLGFDVPEMHHCPLVLKGVSAAVTPTRNGFAITVRSDDPEVAREVLRRLQTSTTSR